MKYIKSYKIFENYKDNSELIEKLRRFNIQNYTINDDGTIDVNGSVYLSDRNLSKIPFKFGKVTGYFECCDNKLTNLDGCPKEVGISFDCSNNKLTNLIGGPQEVGRNYSCSDNHLISLEGCAGDIGKNLECSYNYLTILDCSSVINGNIYCIDNKFEEKPEFFGVCGGKIIWK